MVSSSLKSALRVLHSEIESCRTGYSLVRSRGRTDFEVEILGTWIGDEVNGEIDSRAFVFSGDRLDVIGPEEFCRGTFLLNKSSDPYQIGFHITECSNPDNVGKTTLGIYQIVADALTIAFYPPGNPARPKYKWGQIYV